MLARQGDDFRAVRRRAHTRFDFVESFDNLLEAGLRYASHAPPLNRIGVYRKTRMTSLPIITNKTIDPIANIMNRCITFGDRIWIRECTTRTPT